MHIQGEQNKTASSQLHPKSQCIHELFEQQVRLTPEVVALVDHSCTFTYRALNDRTNQLARVLQQSGVGAETVVGCHLSRSVGVVQCILAILKAGGAYLLLDPLLPEQRLLYMIDDSKPVLILSDTTLPTIVRNSGVQVVMLKDAFAEAGRLPVSDLQSGAKPENTAYMAYTSGSTGRPKGVIITHKATVNHSCDFSRRFQLTKEDRVPIMAPITFDMATEEIVPPLMSGCRLIVSSSNHTSMPDFHDEVLSRRYTILNIPAPLWHMWTEYLRARKRHVPPKLRLVIVGSDKIYTSRFMDWKKLPGAHRAKWVAAYGTTETTVTSSFYTAAWDDDLNDEPTIPIGRPISNTSLYILDELGRPVQENEVGELYIGGQGVARGYHNRPELTEERFLPDPFSNEPEARMYRTGDLARERPDGNVVCLGRKDCQVKINGLRIELGEIEAVLAEHPAVCQAVAILREAAGRTTDRQLAAFVTLRRGFRLPHDLLVFASRRLHPHMVPKQVTALPNLPLNINGKLDRKLLENSLLNSDIKRFA